MPSPAVNRDIISSEVNTTHFQTYLNGNPVGTPYNLTGLVYNRREILKRPASISRPFIDGWREPTAWDVVDVMIELQYGHERVHVPSGYASNVWNENSYDKSAYQGVNTWPDLPNFRNSLANKAEIRCYDQLKNQNIHLGNFLATAKDTIRLFTSHGASIAKQVGRYRKRFPADFQRARRNEPLKARPRKNGWQNCIPESWLELQYGWNPLLADVLGALQELEKNSSEAGAVVVARGTATDHSERTWNIKYREDNRAYTEVTTQLTEHADCRLWFVLNDVTLAELSSLGLINPAEIMWELLPFSFVVDWFTPVSSWLAALTADVGFSFKSGTLSRKIVETPKQTTLVNNIPLSVRPSGFGPAKVSMLAKHFNRSVYSSAPVPGLYLKNPLSGYHVANTIALLIQAFK